MADTPRKRLQCDAQRQSPSTSLAHRTRAPPVTHARRQTSPSSGPRDASAPAVSANAPPIHGANHEDDEDDEDYTSSSGSDSDSDGDDGGGDGGGDAGSDDEHARRLEDGDGNAAAAVPHISGRAKPRIHRVQGDAGLMARLSAFLPQMKTANEDLQREIDAGRGMEWRLDEADENAEGRYIEMNLGLGVLEEQHSDDEGKGEKSEEPNKDSETRSKSETDSNVMDTLMGNDDSPSSKKPTIQEL